MAAQIELTEPGKLLDIHGRLAHIGWSRQPMLECNLENADFYVLKPLQKLRVKRWDYYAVFTPQRFFSATIADIGYAANVFVYTLDFASGEIHEEGIITPLGKGSRLPRGSESGQTSFENDQARLRFKVQSGTRTLSVDWPGFHNGRGIKADLTLDVPPQHESMTITIPIGRQRFYYNRKINCLPASGTIDYGKVHETLSPKECLGSLDWGRGVWDYKSFWNWASASAYLPDGRTLGLNFGRGFGDLSLATENCIILDGRLQKLDEVRFDYTPGDKMKPWHFKDNQGRLDLLFTPFKERIARSNLLIIFSEVHQMFGRYTGRIVLDDGKVLEVVNLIGFAEEHHARW